jgi:[protein-PII] uridylyltransferase
VGDLELSLSEQRRQRAADADVLLREVFTSAIERLNDGHRQGLALVAVGGYGRAELSPASDLDVVLLHDPGIAEDRIQAVAEAIWYPLWERGIALDHSVRDTVQMRQAAHEDYRAATGMLDARHVAGDSSIVLALRAEVLADWRRDARTRLAELREASLKRVERFGWLAHAAVPDLKESGGGLRDGVVMRALVATWLVDVPHAESEELRSALLDVRDALHITAGRRLEKFDPEHILEVAAYLGRDPEVLEFETRNIGRRIAHLATQAWRRVDDALRSPKPGSASPSRPVVEPIADGVGRLGDEVVVMAGTDPLADPELALRAAAAAARARLEFESSSAANLARNLGRIPEPWSPSASRAMVDLLTAGPGLVSVWDELDHAGVVDHWLPEWNDIRLRGSSSAVHRFTVDRHTIETCVNATKLARAVARPDLLSVAALLHDIGKGRPGDHSIVGEGMARDIAKRWGFDDADADIIARLVRHHLTLPNVATRRDIEDPSTAANLAEIVESEEFLDLLAALTAADAQATGPTAWTTWRRGLIEGLVEKTRRVLDGTATGVTSYEGWPAGVPMPDAADLGPDEIRITVQTHRGGSLLTFALRDRPGIMAAIAACFAVLGLEIRSARTLTIDEVAVSMWEVTRADVDIARVRDRLLPVLNGEVDLAGRLALNNSADEEPPRIRILPRRSETATLIEVRAQDRRGLVWTVCREIAEAGHSIRSAHLSTYGTEARDVFYVVDADQGRPLDDDAAMRLREAIADALA